MAAYQKASIVSFFFPFFFVVSFSFILYYIFDVFFSSFPLPSPPTYQFPSSPPILSFSYFQLKKKKILFSTRKNIFFFFSLLITVQKINVHKKKPVKALFVVKLKFIVKIELNNKKTNGNLAKKKNSWNRLNRDSIFTVNCWTVYRCHQHCHYHHYAICNHHSCWRLS